MYRCEDLYSRMCARANPVEGPVLTEMAGSLVLLPAERRFATVEDIPRFIRSLRSGDGSLWPDSVPDVEVRRRRGATRAHWEAPATIAIPDEPEFRREHVVLHELAHHLDHHTRSQGAPPHGAPFRAWLLKLHGVAAGPVGAWALGVVFAEQLS